MTEKEAAGVADILKTLQPAASYVGGIPGRVAGIPGAVGGFTLNTARRAGNLLGQLGGSRTLGTKTVGALQRGAERLTGMAHTSKFNPLNVAIGAGTLGAGYSALKGKTNSTAGGAGGAGGGTGPAVLKAPGVKAPPGVKIPKVAPGAPATPPATGGGLIDLSRRGLEMWKGLPVEARYAIGAGVPLALLGGYMGRKGGLGGLGLGALGLGAAALGGASSGLFGDNARRFSGNMLYNVGSFFGGKDDPANQLDLLSKLSPEIGTTILMGRNKALSPTEARRQYDFLTQNPDMIKSLLPMATNKSAGALFKIARCWKGYEPVPGKAPYSEDSCRPVGSKKKKKEEKKAESHAFKLTEKEHDEVIDGGKPSAEGVSHHKVTSRDAAEGEDLRPHGALAEPDTKPTRD